MKGSVGRGAGKGRSRLVELRESEGKERKAAKGFFGARCRLRRWKNATLCVTNPTSRRKNRAPESKVTIPLRRVLRGRLRCRDLVRGLESAGLWRR